MFKYWLFGGFVNSPVYLCFLCFIILLASCYGQKLLLCFLCDGASCFILGEAAVLFFYSGWFHFLPTWVLPHVPLALPFSFFRMKEIYVTTFFTRLWIHAGSGGLESTHKPYGWTDGRMNGRTDRWVDVWMDEWVDRRVDGQTAGRMDGWMDW